MRKPVQWNLIPLVIVSSDGTAIVNSHAFTCLVGVDGEGVWPAFQLVVNFTADTFTEPNGTITSPNYPSNYPDNTAITYYIQASVPATITLIFVDFQLESSSGCIYDYVQVSVRRTTTEILY